MQPTPAAVRSALAGLDARGQKIVVGLLTVMVKSPDRVREREWIAEQLAQVTLLTGEVEADSAQATVAAVQDFLGERSADLLNATYLLFQRVGLDLAPRAAEGFGFEEALASALTYLPEKRDESDASAPRSSRDLGEQPLARLMSESGLTPNDLVAASTEQLTHKMVTRALKGRRLTANTMGKVVRAWNRASSGAQTAAELFNYEP
jgi:hypothetical protein